MRRSRAHAVQPNGTVREVEYVPASVASEKHNDIGNENGERSEQDRNGRLAHAQRANQKIAEAAGMQLGDSSQAQNNRNAGVTLRTVSSARMKQIELEVRPIFPS